MAQVTFISDEHDDDLLVGVVAQLLQPTLDAIKRHMLANIVDQQGTHGSAIVPTKSSNKVSK